MNEGYSKDEVLLNFDRLGGEVKAGSLMAITAVKGDSARGSSAYGSVNMHSSGYNEARRDPNFSLLDQDYISSRYVFVAKDMSSDMKARQPEVEVSVSKHIADAFGMKKGSQVALAQV